MRLSAIVLLTGCASLGYVKVEFAGAREDIQACRVDPKRENAVCVDMTSFQLEFNEHLKRMTPSEKQALLFERDWAEGEERCVEVEWGKYCEAP